MMSKLFQLTVFWLVKTVLCGRLNWLAEKEGNGYDVTQYPTYSERTPTTISISFFVEAIGNFQIHSMDYEIDLYFMEQWNDRRLYHEERECFLFNDWDHVKRIWRPDVYLSNSKSANYNEVTVPNHVIQVCPGGRMRFSTRISAIVACHMNLKLYPFDRQTCVLKLLTYGHNASQVLLRWLTPNPIEVNPASADADLRLNSTEAIMCDGTFSMGNYSCLMARFHFNRVVSQHILQVFAPTFAIVCISWISFWIDPMSVPGRVGLCVTTLLTLATQAAGFSHRLPAVGYAKALDYWMSACLAFLFGALIEFTLVNSICRQVEKLNDKVKSTQPDCVACGSPTSKDEPIEYIDASPLPNVRSRGIECASAVNIHHHNGNACKGLASRALLVTMEKRHQSYATEQDYRRVHIRKLRTRAKNIDKTSQIAFPVAFFTFSLVFAVYYKWLAW